MLKKLTKIGMLAALMAVATTGFAQDDNYSVINCQAAKAGQAFPRTSFWSNWSIGAGLQFDKDFNSNWAFGQGSNLGVDVRFTKQLNWRWKLRMILDAPGLFGSDTLQMDRYGKALVGFSYNFGNHFYGFMDGGMGIKEEHAGWFGLAADMGLGLNFDFGARKQHEIFVEGGLDCIADITTGKGLPTERAFLKVGYAYNFGLTQADLAIIAQRALLTQENLDALNSQITGLEEQLAACKANEQRLENRVAELENELANVKNKNCAEADSLQRLLDQMRSEQGTFYALPFSVLFAVDSYTVTSTESTKLKAIAQVMKDNPDAKFNIVGFCDYTGSDAYNQKLSEKRAEAVKKQLVNKYGIDEDRLTTSGKGKNEAYGDTKLSINRRVSFFRAM